MPVRIRARGLLRRGAVLLTVLALGLAALPGPAGAQTAWSEFTDIADHWSADYVRNLLYTGVISVPEDGRFRPNDPVTRADFAAWLAGAMELQPQGDPAQAPFRDWDRVPEDLRPRVLAAVEAGLITGFPDGTFGPQQTLTRAQMALIFGRALIPLGYEPEDRYRAIFPDGDRIPEWASDATAAVKAGVIQGTYVNGVFAFHPHAAATRGEAATMIVRFVEIRIGVLGLPRPQPRPVAIPSRAATLVYYIDDDNGYTMLQRHGDRLDGVIFWSYRLADAGGTVQGGDRMRVMAWARDTGKPLIALITAHERAINDAFLSDPEAQARFIRHLEGLLDKGYSGVNLDFEYVSASQRDNFTAFVARVSSALKARGAHLSLSVPAKTSDNRSSDWSGAYDYAALSRLVDYIAIMTYDYSWNGGPAGPIGPLHWMRSVLDYAVTQIPAGKILLGLPAYGRDWPAGGGTGRALTVRQIENLLALRGITPRYDASATEATFNYVDDQGLSRVVWFTPAEGVAAKLRLVDQYGLGGFVMWRMGQEVDAYWTSVGQVMR